MPCDAARALAIRSGEQHGLNVIVVTHQQSLDRSGRSMQAGCEIFRQRLPMREDLPLEGDGPALGERGDGALDIAVIPGEQRDQRRSRLSHERRQVPGQHGAVRELPALVNDRDRLPEDAGVRRWCRVAGAAVDARSRTSFVIPSPPALLARPAHDNCCRGSLTDRNMSRRREGVRCCQRRDAVRAVSCAETQPAPPTGRRRRASSSGPPSRAAHHGCGLSRDNQMPPTPSTGATSPGRMNNITAWSHVIRAAASPEVPALAQSRFTSATGTLSSVTTARVRTVPAHAASRQYPAR